MSFSDPPREARAPRKARARISLKMQAIGFLSRREHSRQELRRKLLDSLRQRAREDAALVAAAEKAAQELAQALREQPSNGIDDAFAPTLPVAPSVPAPASATPRGTRGARASKAPNAPGPAMPPRAALDTLTLASGSPLPASLRTRIATGASSAAAPTASASASATAHAAFDSSDDAAFESPDDEPPSPPNAGVHPADLELSDPEAAVDRLLDWLEANKYLSEPRFVESRVNARARKQGTKLIKLELSRHGLTLEPDQAAALRETEFARAQALWQRKFGELAPDAHARAKQARFLAARGFAADVVRRIVGGEEEF